LLRSLAMLRLVVGALVGLAMVHASVAAADPLPVPTVALVVKDDPVPPVDPEKRFFKFRSGTRLLPTNRIVPPAVGSAGDPTLFGATLTVTNVGGDPQTLTIDLPAARWKVIGTATLLKGYQFHDDDVSDGPVFRVFVKTDKLFVVGGRTDWTYVLSTTPQGGVAVRLDVGTGVSWCSEAPAKTPATIYDTPAKFVGVKGSIPALCAP